MPATPIVIPPPSAPPAVGLYHTCTRHGEHHNHGHTDTEDNDDSHEARDDSHEDGGDVGQHGQRDRAAVEPSGHPGTAPAVDTQHRHGPRLTDSRTCASSSAPTTRAWSSRIT